MDLSRIPAFAALSDEERAEVAGCLREVSVESGAQLDTQGEFAYELFLIEEGEAEVLRDGELVRTLAVGDVFGEIALMATGKRTASVVATSPIRLQALFTREFRDLERRMPALATSLRETMADRAARTSF